MPSATRASAVSSASVASSSQRAASSSLSNGAKARTAVASGVSGSGGELGAWLDLRGRRRRRAGGAGAPSVFTTRHALLAPRPGPGSVRPPAAAGRQSRTARIRIAWPEAGILPVGPASRRRGSRWRPGRRCPPFVGQREPRRLDRDLGIFDLPEAVDQALPLVGFEQRRELRFERAVFERVVADVDVVVVVGHREAGFAGQVLERDHLVRLHRPLQRQHVVDQFVGHRPRALVAGHRSAVDDGDIDRVAGAVLGDVAGGGEEAVAAFERGDRQFEAFRAQVLEHRQDAAVDLAGGDVFAAAGVDREAGRRPAPASAAPPWRAAGRRRR